MMGNLTKSGAAAGLFGFLYLCALPGAAFAGDGPHGDHPGKSIIKEFCTQNAEDERCKQIKQRRALMKQCRENPDDEQCEAMREKRRERWRQMKQHCADNPDDKRCNMMKKRHKRWNRKHRGQSGEY